MATTVISYILQFSNEKMGKIWAVLVLHSALFLYLFPYSIYLLYLPLLSKQVIIYAVKSLFTLRSGGFLYIDPWRVHNFSYYTLFVFLLPFQTSGNLWFSPSTSAFILCKPEDFMIAFKLSRYCRTAF